MQIDKVLVIASAFVKNEDSEVLLLQRSKKASYPDFWQMIEGKLETGESPEEAIKREIGEEAGAAASKLDLSTVFYNELEAKGLRYLCFRIVFNVKISSKNIKLSDEHRTFGWFDQTDAMKLQLLPGTKAVLDRLMS